ncbi:MAG: T9SS type A sorting domain-containing protein [bacterium]|nr:T9SS type A sorting domain-containing protein [bacterium]
MNKNPASLPVLATLLLILPLLNGALAAERVVINPTSATGYELSLVSDRDDGSTLRFDLNHFDRTTVAIDGDNWQRITLGDLPVGLERGLPALPSLRESLIIPAASEMALRIVAAEYRDITGSYIAPSRGAFTRNIDPALVTYEFDEFYRQDAWYPAETATLGEPYILRDHRGLVVEINPFRYNPATRTLRVCTSLTIEVSSNGPGKINVQDRSRAVRPITSEFGKIYAGHFLNNRTTGDRAVDPTEIGSMLIIAADELLPSVAPLVTWKNQLGLPTRAVPLSSIGDSPGEIRDYIRTAYEEEGIAYLLLVGDGPQLPTFLVRDGAADPWYSLLVGDDPYPEIMVGRIAADTPTEVSTQVDKFILYERDITVDADWCGRAAGIASREGDGYGDDGESDWVHADNLRQELLGYTYTSVDRLYATLNVSASTVAHAINEGRGLVNYTGHGNVISWRTSNFDVINIGQLTNVGRLPLIVSVACLNGRFARNNCFAEAWLNASRDGEPTGAVGMYAASVNQTWQPPMCAQDEINALLVAGERSSFGGLCFSGAVRMMDRYPVQGPDEFLNWNVFGDPSLRIRTAAPIAPAAELPGSVDPELGTFAIRTAPGARVTLSLAGDLLTSVVANSAGLAELMIPADLDAASVTLTLSGFNMVTLVREMPVGPDGGSTGEPDVTPVVPATALMQNHPNPFNPTTTINFVTAAAGAVRLTLFDVNGRQVRGLVAEHMAAGEHSASWSGRDDNGNPVSAGVYLYRLDVAGEEGSRTRKMILLN